MPTGVSASSIKSTVTSAAENVANRAKAAAPKLEASIDKLDGRLAKSKTYQKGKSAIQKAFSHPKVEQFLNAVSQWFEKLSKKVSKWADNAGERARSAMIKANQAINSSN